MEAVSKLILFTVVITFSLILFSASALGDNFAEDVNEYSVKNSNNWVNNLTLLYTPSIAGDYEIFVGAEIYTKSVASFSCMARIMIDNTPYGIAGGGDGDTTDYRNSFVEMINKTLDTTQHNITIQFTTNGSTSTSYISQQRIFVMPLNSNLFYTSNDTEIPKYTTLSWTNHTVMPFTTVGNNKNYLVLARGEIYNPTQSNGFMQLCIDSACYAPTKFTNPSDGFPRQDLNYFDFENVTLSAGTHTAYIQYYGSSAGIAVRNVRILMIDQTKVTNIAFNQTSKVTGGSSSGDSLTETWTAVAGNYWTISRVHAQSQGLSSALTNQTFALDSNTPIDWLGTSNVQDGASGNITLVQFRNYTSLSAGSHALHVKTWTEAGLGNAVFYDYRVLALLPDYFPVITFASPTPNDGSYVTHNWIYVNVTAGSPAGNDIDTCILEWAGSNTTMTKVGTGASVICYLNETSLNDGSYSYRVFANDTTGLETVTASQSNTVDITPPSPATYQVSTPTTYSSSTLSDFNTTWTDATSGVDSSSVKMETDCTGSATNFTMSKVDATDIYRVQVNLPACIATYWKFYAKDLAGNEVVSATQAGFTINKASLAGTSASANQNYPTAVTATGTETNDGDADVFYQEWCGSGSAYDIQMGSNIQDGNPSGSFVFGVGSYNCKLNTTSATFQNYTASASIGTSSSTVSKGTLAGTSSSPNVNYPTSLTATGTETNSGDTDVVYQEWCGSGSAYDIQMGSNTQDGNPSGSFVFGAGDYNCKLNTTSATFANWTASASIGTSSSTVSKGNLAGTLNQPATVNFGTATSATSSVSNNVGTDVAYQIYCNYVTLMGSATGSAPSGSVILGGGSNSCVLNTTGATFANWTASASIDSKTAIVNKVTPAMNLSIDYLIADKTVNYGATDVISGNSTAMQGAGDLIFNLYKNFLTSLGAGNITITDTFGAGSNNFTYNTTGGQNYTARNIQVNLTVNKGTLSGTLSTPTVNYGTATTATASKSTTGDTDVAYRIYCGNTLMGSATGSAPSGSVILSAGSNSCVFNTTSGTFANYTANSSIAISTATVNKATPAMNLSIDYLFSDKTVAYPTSATIFGNSSTMAGATDVVFTLYQNFQTSLGTGNVTFNNLQGVGNYNFTYNTTDCQNYTARSLQYNLTELIGTPNVNSFIDYLASDKTINYAGFVNTVFTGNTSTTCSNGCTLPTFTLYENYLSKGSGTAVTYNDMKGVGTYTIIYNNTANANWTSATQTRTFTINKGTFVGSSSSPTVTYPTSLTATGTETNSGDTDVIYQEWCGSGSAYDIQMGSNVQDGNPSGSFQFGAGSYNCKLNTTGATFANYSSSASIGTSIGTVDRASSSLSILGSNVTYPNPVSISASESNSVDTDCSYELYRNYLLISGTTDDSILAVGNYIYTFNNSQCTNFTAGTTSRTITVSKGALLGSISTPTIDYPSPLVATSSESNIGDTDVAYQTICGNTISSGLSGSFAFGAGNNNCLLNTTGATFANWTANASIATSTGMINKGVLLGSISGSDVVYPNAVNMVPSKSSTGDADVNYTFWRNDTLVSSAIGSSPLADTSLLGNGTYVYILNSTGGLNSTANASIATLTIVVNKGVLSGSISAPMVTYPTSLTATGTETNSGDADVVYTVYCDNQLMGQAINGNPSGSFQFSAGNQNCKLNTTGATFANWTTNSSIATATGTINKGTLTGSIIGVDVVFPAPANVNTSVSNAGANDVNYTFYRNETFISYAIGSSPTGDSSSLGVDVYEYLLNTTGDTFENYTSSSQIALADYKVVSSGHTDVEVWIDGEPSNKTVTYPTSVTIKGNSTIISSPPIFNLFVDGVLQSTGNPASVTMLFGAGTHEVVYNTSGNLNWTSNTTSIYLIVDQNSTTRILLFNGTSGDLYVQNGTSWRPFAVNITACKSVDDETLNLLKDGISVGTANAFSGTYCVSEINTTMPAGNYNFTVDMTQSNYTSSVVSNTVFVRDDTIYVPKLNESDDRSWNTSTSFNIDWLGSNSNMTMNITIFKNDTDSHLNYTDVQTDFTSESPVYTSYWNNLDALKQYANYDFNNPNSTILHLWTRTPYVRSYSNTKEILTNQNRWTFDFTFNMTMNDTDSQNLIVPIPKSVLNEYGTATTTVSILTVDGTTQNVTYVDAGSTINVIIGMFHSSVSEDFGLHSGEFIYLVTTGQTGGTTGGGGGVTVIVKNVTQVISNVTNVTAITFSIYPVDLTPPKGVDILPNSIIRLTTPITVQNLGTAITDYQSFFTCPTEIIIGTGKEVPIPNCAQKWCYIVNQTSILRIPPRGYATFNFECKVSENATIGQTYSTNFCVEDMTTKKARCSTISIPVGYANQTQNQNPFAFLNLGDFAKAISFLDYSFICFNGADDSKCLWLVFPQQDVNLAGIKITQFLSIGQILVIAFAVLAIVFKKKYLWIPVVILIIYMTFTYLISI